MMLRLRRGPDEMWVDSRDLHDAQLLAGRYGDAAYFDQEGKVPEDLASRFAYGLNVALDTVPDGSDTPAEFGPRLAGPEGRDLLEGLICFARDGSFFCDPPHALRPASDPSAEFYYLTRYHEMLRQPFWEIDPYEWRVAFLTFQNFQWKKAQIEAEYQESMDEEIIPLLPRQEDEEDD